MPTECSAHLRASVPYNWKHLQQQLSKSIYGESSTLTNNYIEFGKNSIKIVNTWPSPWFSALFTTCKVLKYFNMKAPGKYHINSVWICKIYSRLKKSNKMQQYADIYLLLNSSTCFGHPSRPSSGGHKTVVAVSGTDHTIWEASFFKRDQIRSLLPRKYDLYQRPQLQFCVLLMMGATDARNM